MTKSAKPPKSPASEKPPVRDTGYFFENRELSWLKFDRRVLEESQSPDVPVLEQLKFLRIFADNMDEFFMIRVGSLYEQSLLRQMPVDNKTGWDAKRQLREIYAAMPELYGLYEESFSGVDARLRGAGIEYLRPDQLNSAQRRYIRQYFKHEVMPLLSPLVIDAKHPFPHIENKRLCIAVELEHAEKKALGVVVLPDALTHERCVFLPQELCGGAKCRYLLAEEILLSYVKDIYKAHTVRKKLIMRITRNADVEVEDSFADTDADYRVFVKEILKKRGKMSPVRLECNAASPKLIEQIAGKLALAKHQVFVCGVPLSLDYVGELTDVAGKSGKFGPELSFPPLEPQWPANIDQNLPVIDQVLQRDRFMSLPYNSFRPYIRLLREAAENPDVLGIKISIYRLSTSSMVIEQLCAAAEAGKEVTVVMELRARFDEENNIAWSRRLEESGCKVIYGIDNFKVHSKITLITLRREGQIRYISHIATGNYNESTARFYTDVGILTADGGVGADAVTFFQSLLSGVTTDGYKSLLVSPTTLKSGLLRLIGEQTALAREGRPALIRMKINSMTDLEIMDELYHASCAGVKVQMIVRGICCLVPGIPGMSENIEVISIVGRFLEHSRIFIFGGGDESKVFISSADMMTRNTTRRLEICCPVYDRGICAAFTELFTLQWGDTAKARRLLPDGRYERVAPPEGEPPVDSQMLLQQTENK